MRENNNGLYFANTFIYYFFPFPIPFHFLYSFDHAVNLVSYVSSNKAPLEQIQNNAKYLIV